MSTEIIVTASNGHLSGKTAADAEAIAELEDGATYRAVLTEPSNRSLSQLRLWWRVCEMIADNYPGDLTKDDVDGVLRIECGHSTVWKDAGGTYRRSPKSIGFAKMGQAEFNALMDLMWSHAGRLFGGELSQAVRDELDRMAAPMLKDAA